MTEDIYDRRVGEVAGELDRCIDSYSEQFIDKI
jgi:hypothetical protein